MVAKKAVSARPPSLGGVVDFNPDQGRGLAPEPVGAKVDKLLDVLDKSNHLIHKEAMAHKVSLEELRRCRGRIEPPSVRLPPFGRF